MALSPSGICGKKDLSTTICKAQLPNFSSCQSNSSFLTGSSRAGLGLAPSGLRTVGVARKGMQPSRHQSSFGARAVYKEMSEQGSKTDGNGKHGLTNGKAMVDTPELSPEWIEAWKDELILASGKEGEVDSKQWKDPLWVQTQIDKRCVQNMRMLVIDSVNTAKAGHPGLPMGITEVGYTLYKYAMRYNPKNPGWFNRDRFVLSAGHGCLLQYICLHLAGFGVEVCSLLDFF
jgi:hypothetical protein